MRGSTCSPALSVLGLKLPGGPPYPRTMAFITLMLLQLFNVFSARSDERSAFSGLFHNPWLWGAPLLSLLLQILVVYAPFLSSASPSAVKFRSNEASEEARSNIRIPSRMGRLSRVLEFFVERL